MIRRPPRSTPGRTLFPYTTLFRSGLECLLGGPMCSGSTLTASGKPHVLLLRHPPKATTGYAASAVRRHDLHQAYLSAGVGATSSAALSTPRSRTIAARERGAGAVDHRQGLRRLPPSARTSSSTSSAGKFHHPQGHRQRRAPRGELQPHPGPACPCPRS